MEWLQQYGMFIIIALLLVAFVLLMVFQNKKRKKQEQESKDLINAVKPGNKVKTIGGLCGIVVEVDSEENTFVLETGSVTAGKSYIKLDRQAIWQTDAVVEKKEEEAGTQKEEQKDSKDGETPVETPAQENAQEQTTEPEAAPAGGEEKTEAE